jgi:hypothetical protein
MVKVNFTGKHSTIFNTATILSVKRFLYMSNNTKHNDIQHNNKKRNNVILSVVMLSVANRLIMLSVVMLRAVAPPNDTQNS